MWISAKYPTSLSLDYGVDRDNLSLDMDVYYDIELTLRLREDDVILTEAYFRGCVERSLNQLFGDIGGQVSIQILKFDPLHKRIVLRVASEHYKQTRIALTLIGQFQEIPCHIKVCHVAKNKA